jgi:hypothetical protein
MPFQKGHKLGFTSDAPLDKDPVCFKVMPGVKARLKAVPNWQEQLREYVDQLIQEESLKQDRDRDRHLLKYQASSTSLDIFSFQHDYGRAEVKRQRCCQPTEVNL